MAIDVDTLKSERDQLKDVLRKLEVEQKQLEAQLKGLRQREIRAKREIEALSTLIELNQARDDTDQPDEGAGTSSAAPPG